MKKIIMLLACVASTDQLHAMQSMGARAAYQMTGTLKRQVFIDAYKNWKKKYYYNGKFDHTSAFLNLMGKGAIAGAVVFPNAALLLSYRKNIELFHENENHFTKMLGMALIGAWSGAFLLPAATYGAPLFYPYLIYQVYMVKKRVHENSVAPEKSSD